MYADLTRQSFSLASIACLLETKKGQGPGLTYYPLKLHSYELVYAPAIEVTFLL